MPFSCVSSLPEGWSGLRIRYAEPSPAASRATTATTTMISVRVLGRRGTPRQCANMLRRACTGAVVVVAVVASAAEARGPATTDEPGSIVAAFPQRSYAPGEQAELQLRSGVHHVTAQFFHAGPERLRSPRDDVLGGVPVGPAFALGAGSDRRLTAPHGPSGLYFLQLSAPGGKLGYAPFVLRPARLGKRRDLVVLPTNTWAAYNFRDVDGNGVGDTWYADPHFNGVDLTRPFLNRGVPPHYRGYDRGFLHWLAHTGKRPDFLADEDLERLSGKRLASLYDLIVFSGHDEYATKHVWNAIRDYRNADDNRRSPSANASV